MKNEKNANFFRWNFDGKTWRESRGPWCKYIGDTIVIARVVETGRIGISRLQCRNRSMRHVVAFIVGSIRVSILGKNHPSFHSFLFLSLSLCDEREETRLVCRLVSKNLSG